MGLLLPHCYEQLYYSDRCSAHYTLYFSNSGIGFALSKKQKYKVTQKYLMQGLALKLLCGIGFGWTYVYYYGGGDTQMYFRGATEIFNYVYDGKGLDIFFDDYLLPRGSDATHFTQRFAGLVNLFSFNSYWACTLIFAAFSFIGLWLLFISFFKQFPQQHQQLAIVTLFVPGVVFWSSGIMKDSICMLFIGVIVYCIQNIFLYNRNIIFNIIMTALGFYVLVNLKAYIALALIAAIALYAILAVKTKIKNKTARALVTPVLAVFMAGGALLMMRNIGQYFEKYSLENLAETAQTYQGYHERTSVAGRGTTGVRTGSGYTLGEINFNNPLNIIGKFPLAVNVTFFRPYVWEVKNPVMLLSALESLAILLFTINVIRRKGFGKFFKMFASNKDVLFCMTFALIFGFAVGFTTYNFGSLVRYKAPCIPFFLIAIVLINASVEKKKGLSTTSKRSATPYSMPQQLS